MPFGTNCSTEARFTFFLADVLAMETAPKASPDEFVAEMRKVVEAVLGTVTDRINGAQRRKPSDAAARRSATS